MFSVTEGAVKIVRVEQTSISLSWEVSKACFESVDFTITISWNPCTGEEQVTNVSGSSYDVTGLSPGVRYGITFVSIGNDIRSDTISICITTLPSGEHNSYECISSFPLRPISFRYTMHVGVHMYIRITGMYL